MTEPRCIAGDSRRPEAYAEALAGETAALLLTDPPYCLLTRRRKGGDERDKRRGVKIDRDPIVRFEDVREYREFTAQWLGAAAKHVAPGSPFVIWTNFLGKQPLRDVAAKLGRPHLLGEFVWAKFTTQRPPGAEALRGSEESLRVYEVALVLGAQPLQPRAVSEPSLTWCVAAGYDDDGEAARWGSHPNHKPFPVLEPLVRDWTAPGALVLDPFGGSGSIPAAALRLGRRVACIELEADWAARITDRLRRSTQPGMRGESAAVTQR
jgi:site-specific DNA-methyltransferase (adenine-specific)